METRGALAAKASVAATERVLRVPKGFMRDRIQTRIEELAAERGAATVDLEHVEAGIEMGLQLMKEMISTYGGASPEMKASEAPKAECPVPEAEQQASAGNGNGKGRPLNEVSVMSELDKARQGLGEADA